MKFKYHDDFDGHADEEYPDGWQIERHSALGHGHAYMLNGAFVLLLPGNKHIAPTPPLADFSLEIRCHGDIHFNTVTGIVIYFRYDPKARQGYYLYAQWGAEGMTATFGIHADGRYQPLQTRQAAEQVKDTSRSQKLRLVVAGERAEFFCGKVALGPFEDIKRTLTRPGQIAFDHSAVAGATTKRVAVLGRHLFLESVRITSDLDFPARDICPPLRIKFPTAINGMQKPFIFKITAREIGGCYVLGVRLTGGSTNVPPDFPGGFYLCNEELVRPYVRLETADGREMGPYHLVNGRVGLSASKDKKNFLFFPADAECPVRMNIHLAEFPADVRLFVGYEFYQHEGAPHQRGGPTEAWVNPKTGEIRYVGAPLRSGCRIPEIRSPEDKEICRQLPKDDPRYEQALAFARANHFFMEKEPCVFRASLRLRHPSFKPNEWTMRAHLENAFREPMPDELLCEQKPADDALSAELKRDLGVETLITEIRVRNSLPVGVYHLAVQWSEGTQVAVTKRCAFEVMPADPHGMPAPLASGLPELHSFPDESSGLTTSPFDPWLASTVDECHYMTGAYYQADFAREQKIWKTLHFYRRQWQLILTRSCANNDPASYADLIKEADMVCTLPWRTQPRCDLWKRGSYTGDVLVAFREFVQKHILDTEERSQLTATETPQGRLKPQAFKMLAERYWKPWLDYFLRFATERLQQMHQFVLSLNPRARHTFLYALYPPYASIYKGGYFLLYFGYDVTQPPIRSLGPLFLEDYPMLCRYGIQRGVYQLAAMKLAAPEQKLFVEMYSGCAVPVDGGLLFGNPPYSVCYAPPLYFRKRLFEFAYGAVWFGKEGFAFWKDYGFHARFWDPEQYQAFLETWAEIRRAPPAKPLRSTAYASSMAVCRSHPDYHETDRLDGCGDMYNTAEECTAYAYEQARADGQPAGFLLDLDAICKLDPSDVDTMVLPPLTGVSPDILAAIREKHRMGVNLVAFENVTGLEDLFGVTPLAEPVAINTIRVNPDTAEDPPWRELAGQQEVCNHPLCQTHYALKDARSLLHGLDTQGRTAGPVLTIHQTKWGQAALFCVPPTVVNRADQKEHCQYGQECLSHLMDRSMALVLRFLGRPQVETTAGKLIAFKDDKGRIRVIVTEDAWPGMPKRIEPRVTLHLPGIRREAISCDRPFSILEVKPDQVSVRVNLDPHASAMITVEDTSGNI